MSPNRIAAAVLGTVLGLLGATGLVVALSTGAEPTGVLVLGVFSTNALLGALQLALGGVLVAGSLRGDPPARHANVAVGAVLLVLGLFGLFAVGTPANVIALNGADNVLHFAASSALLATGLGAARSAAGSGARLDG